MKAEKGDGRHLTVSVVSVCQWNILSKQHKSAGNQGTEQTHLNASWYMMQGKSPMGTGNDWAQA
ncbi:hypothetical protein [Oscillibacter sp.]|uniref:hypothetical protein n=1 Tax=Oscillibacter sp. TaxID=1945593 RepID=UPI0028AC46CD|nr:hypothetical protein [Oscillibacter sp.]